MARCGGRSQAHLDAQVTLRAGRRAPRPRPRRWAACAESGRADARPGPVPSTPDLGRLGRAVVDQRAAHHLSPAGASGPWRWPLVIFVARVAERNQANSAGASVGVLNSKAASTHVGSTLTSRRAHRAGAPVQAVLRGGRGCQRVSGVRPAALLSKNYSPARRSDLAPLRHDEVLGHRAGRTLARYLLERSVSFSDNGSSDLPLAFPPSGLNNLNGLSSADLESYPLSRSYPVRSRTRATIQAHSAQRCREQSETQGRNCLLSVKGILEPRSGNASLSPSRCSPSMTVEIAVTIRCRRWYLTRTDKTQCQPEPNEAGAGGREEQRI